MARPHILLITTDQWRWDFLDQRTVPGLRTPAIHGLMAAGTTLTHAYSNCPICIPTRFTWAHGLYASQAAADLMANWHDWPTRLPSMPQALQRAGYHTALVGKLHSKEGLYHRDLCAPENIADTRARGFDDVLEVCGKSLAFWFDCSWTRHLATRELLDAYRADLWRRCVREGSRDDGAPSVLPSEDSMDSFIGRQARQWLASYAGERPFFLHASFCGPHFPIDPPAEYHTRYRAEDMPIPAGVDDPETIRYYRQLGASYCANIEHLDTEIGRLLAALESQGLAAETVVLFANDHGDMMGHHGQWGKGTAYDTSCRTPYIVRWPGQVPSGVVRESMVEAVDLPCTLLEIAGLSEPPTAYLPGTPGRSFLSYVRGETDAHRPWAYAEYSGWGVHWHMCCEPDWKYVMHLSGDDQLFNLTHDPWELHNLIDDPAQNVRVSRMRRQLLQSMAACPAPNNIPQRPRDDWWLRTPAGEACCALEDAR